MTEETKKAIKSIQEGKISFCKFITANDTGATDSHQAGFYIPKTSFSLFFDKAGVKGNNMEKFIKIKWQDNFNTDSRAIYYGQGTRNEYRLTRFGKGFPFLQDTYTGGLLIITKHDQDYYSAFVLNTEAEIEEFLNAFNISPADTNSLIAIKKQEPSDKEALISKFLSTLPDKFPETTAIAEWARNISFQMKSTSSQTASNHPDITIIDWIQTEYELFKRLEDHYDLDQIKQFDSIDKFMEKANSLLNRRKSRAGKSLEHHLNLIFKTNALRFSHPGRTEANKKPDFIFPGNNEYHNQTFNKNKLTFLGSKTTCKDRWRQILNEADRIPLKHLFTLQQGISKNQLDEMWKSKVILVVPQIYISTYPQEYREKILNLKTFIDVTKIKQTQ